MKEILPKYKAVIQGHVGKWTYQPFKIHLKPDAKQLHGKAYIIPHTSFSPVEKYLSRLE